VRARVHAAACLGAIGFALGYALPAYARLANLFYDPVARRFFVASRPGPVPMGYWGQGLYAVAGGLLGVALGGVLGLRRREPSSSTIGLLGAWALTAMTLVAAYFTWNNWP
jgi:hypothetical protein